MKKTALIACTVTVCLMIFVKSGIIDSLVFFILAGIVPGTRYAVPSTFMLLLMTSIAWLLFFRLIPFDMFLHRSVKNTAKKKRQLHSSKRLPKRRYEQI